MLKYVCVRDVMDVVFSVLLCRVKLQVLMYGKCECFVMHMLYVCVLCASCGSSQAAFCITCRLLRLVEDARGDHMEETYSRAGLMTAL